MIVTCVNCKVPAEIIYAAGRCKNEPACPVFENMSDSEREAFRKYYDHEISEEEFEELLLAEGYQLGYDDDEEYDDDYEDDFDDLSSYGEEGEALGYWAGDVPEPKYNLDEDEGV